MNMLLSISFALIVFIAGNVNGQSDSFVLNTGDREQLFGQFQNVIANQDQTPSISCFRVRPNIKNPHPTDNTKYVICRDENRFDVLTCPNGGIFDNSQKACIDLCEQKKPCLNQGQCIIHANLTLGCVCRRDWTGERCETPLSTCASQPCGPNAECRMLHASDYSQDYVCLCNNQQTYGRNCQQTVPNPCLESVQQFHPFAFSRRAYINCDDSWIFFQPCNGLLYWNQEDKRCDRSLPDLLRAPFMNIRFQSNGMSNRMNIPQWISNNFEQNQKPTVQSEQQFSMQSQPWQGSFNNQPLQNWQSSQQESSDRTNEQQSFHSFQRF